MRGEGRFIMKRAALGVVWFAGATFVTWLALMPSESAAAERRLHASGCRGLQEWHDDLLDNEGYGIGNNDTQGSVMADCPFNDDDTFRADQLTALNVHVYDNWNGTGFAYDVGAQLCITYWGSNGGTCGTWADTLGNAGNYTLQPSRSVWSYDARYDFHFVRISLGKKNGSVEAKVRGIWAYKP